MRTVFYGIHRASLTIQRVDQWGDTLTRSGNTGSVFSHKVTGGRSPRGEVVMAFNMTDIIECPMDMERSESFKQEKAQLQATLDKLIAERDAQASAETPKP